MKPARIISKQIEFKSGAVLRFFKAINLETGDLICAGMNRLSCKSECERRGFLLV